MNERKHQDEHASPCNKAQQKCGEWMFLSQYTNHSERIA